MIRRIRRRVSRRRRTTTKTRRTTTNTRRRKRGSYHSMKLRVFVITRS